MAVGQNQWYHFGVGAPLILGHFSGDWYVHWGYEFLTHGQMLRRRILVAGAADLRFVER